MVYDTEKKKEHFKLSKVALGILINYFTREL